MQIRHKGRPTGSAHRHRERERPLDRRAGTCESGAASPCCGRSRHHHCCDPGRASGRRPDGRTLGTCRGPGRRGDRSNRDDAHALRAWPRLPFGARTWFAICHTRLQQVRHRPAPASGRRDPHHRRRGPSAPLFPAP